MSETDAALVVKAQAGDQFAFEELVRRTSRLLLARLYLDTGDHHRAEDLVQETWLRAYRAFGRLSQPERLRGWLLTIAQNVLADDRRGNLRHKRTAPPPIAPSIFAALAVQVGPEAAPVEEASRSEERARVLEVLRALPEEYRLPLSLRYLAGADYATIEVQLGLTNGALRGLLHRGLKMLRTVLGPELGFEKDEADQG